MKIRAYTYEEKQIALDEAHKIMNPVSETTAERLKTHLDNNAATYYAPIAKQKEVNAELLEEIKSDWFNEDSIANGNVNWLIERAERAQELEAYCEKSANFINQIELEKENKRQSLKIEELKAILSHSKSENKRLREALGIYGDGENWWTYPVPGGHASAASVDKGRKARQALEGVSSDQTLKK